MSELLKDTNLFLDRRGMKRWVRVIIKRIKVKIGKITPSPPFLEINIFFFNIELLYFSRRGGRVIKKKFHKERSVPVLQFYNTKMDEKRGGRLIEKSTYVILVLYNKLFNV